jgi:hypothetical protein
MKSPKPIKTIPSARELGFGFLGYEYDERAKALSPEGSLARNMILAFQDLLADIAKRSEDEEVKRACVVVDREISREKETIFSNPRMQSSSRI